MSPDMSPAENRNPLCVNGFYTLQCIKIHYFGGQFLPRAVFFTLFIAHSSLVAY